MSGVARLEFEAGTLVLDGVPELEMAPGGPETGPVPMIGSGLSRPRLRLCRAGDCAAGLRRQTGGPGTKIHFARRPFIAVELIPRPHQEEAFRAWRDGLFRGLVSLPTGSGKTILAVMAAAYLKRSALFLVPTLDLLSQWVGVLEHFFGRRSACSGEGSAKFWISR